MPENKKGGGSRVRAEASFRDYIAAFNRGDTTAYGACYCHDVTLEIADHTILEGPQAIIDFYAGVASGTERTIGIVKVMAGGDCLAAELESEFLATVDLPDFAPRPMKAGDRLYLNTFVFYDLEDGKYKRIRSATHRRLFRPHG
jgi:ketosteroid isomerase-like protein